MIFCRPSNYTRKEPPVTKTDIQATPNSLDITMTREFAAPPALLYRAFSEPDLLKKWLGPKRLKMTIDNYDLRHGGSYRYVHADDEGNAYARLGNVLADLGRKDEARAAYEKGISQSEKHGHSGMAEDLRLALIQLNG